MSWSLEFCSIESSGCFRLVSYYHRTNGSSPPHLGAWIKHQGRRLGTGPLPEGLTHPAVCGGGSVPSDATPDRSSEWLLAERSQQENPGPVLLSTNCHEVQWFPMTSLGHSEHAAVFSGGAAACSEITTSSSLCRLPLPHSLWPRIVSLSEVICI